MLIVVFIPPDMLAGLGDRYWDSDDSEVEDEVDGDVAAAVNSVDNADALLPMASGVAFVWA